MGSIGGDELHSEIEDMGFHDERILVSVRMRPLNSKEIARNDVIDWECIDENTIINRNSVSDQRSLYPNGYSFDKVFQWDSPTKQVYEEGAKKVALSVVSGINASIFAYGQTSSGKTYTMRGVTAYTVEDIYEYIHKHVEREFVLKFSAMEIYNEAVRDLLSADGTPLRLLDDPERGTVVDKLTEETLRDLDHLKELLSVCEAQRQIGETSLNEASSRSHQILRLTIESSAREFVGKDNSSTLAASVDFVDLAGSERASQALSAGTRLKEGCHINRSLLTLGTVIRKLSKGRNGHVPYRDSKLTRILQCSLGGNARTAIICTISPARGHVEQSRNTLTFASCAKEVATNAQVNIVVSDKALVKQLQKELARLASELRSTVPPSATDSAELLREKDLRIEKLEKEIKDLIHQRDLAQSRLVELVHVGGDDHASEQWEEYDQPIRLRAPLTLSDDDLTSESSGLADRHCLDVGFTRINSSQYSNGFSESYSDEPYVHIPETPVDQFLSNGISPQFSVSDTKFVEVDPEEAIRGEMITERTDKNIEEVCKDVRCIEMEDSSTRIARSSSFMSHEFKRILPFTLTGNGEATYQALFLSAQKGHRGLEEVLSKYGIDQISQFFPEKTDRELREHQTRYCIDQASSLSPQKGDKGLREVQTEYNVDQTLPLSPEMREKGSRKVQSEYGINQLLSLSQEKGDKGLREVQTEYCMDKAPPLFPREGDKELRELQPEHVIDQELPLSPRDGDKEMTEVQTEYDVDQPLSSSPHPADKELCKVQTEYGPDEVLSLSQQKGDKELGEVQTEHGAVQAFCLSQGKGEKESMESQQEYGFVESKVQDVQESSENMVNPLPEEPSSWSRTEDVPNSTSLKLARSRSCRANLMTSPVSPWFQNAEQNENTPSNEHEKDFPGRPKGIQRKFSALNFSPSSPRFSREDSLTSEQSTSADEFKAHNVGNSSRYSRQGSFTSEQSASVDEVKAHITKNSSRYSRQDSFTSEQRASPYEVKVHNIETPSEKEITTIDTFVSKLKEMTKLESEKKEKDDQVQEVEQNTNGSEKNVKDLALDLVENHVESHSNWTSEFEKQQREIIELWQVCNVSLVHRTYFFLLFKGDPTDSIYMEVERRRLSFIKDRISQANDNKLIVEGVPDLTQASSLKALRREREMLTKQMVKRLSEVERVNLYKKWGIGLKTKQRKQQLARLLWSDTKDMNRVMESATLVARLVGLLEPGQAPKEMFGLSFIPQQLSSRSYSWRTGMSTFL